MFVVPASKEYTEGVLKIVDSYVFGADQIAYNFLQTLKRQHTVVKFSDYDNLGKFQDLYLKDDELSNRLTGHCVFDKWLFKFKSTWFSAKYDAEQNMLSVIVLSKMTDTYNFEMLLHIGLESHKWHYTSAQDVFCSNYDVFQRNRPLASREHDKKLVKGWEKARTEEGFRSDNRRAELNVGTVLLILAYINYQIEQEREWKETLKEEMDNTVSVTDNKPISEVKSTTTSNSTPGNKKGIITIGDLRFTVPKGSGITRTKIMKRHKEVWGVRGHYRHYKNGRIVFIKPYKKGAKRNELEPISKDYLIK